MNAKKKSFSFHWDYETDSLVVLCKYPHGTQMTKQYITKETLENVSAAKFMWLLNTMADALESQPPFKHSLNHEIDYLMPQIKKIWEGIVGPTPDLNMQYHPYKEQFRLYVGSQCVLSLDQWIVEDQQYGNIKDLVITAAKMWQGEHIQQAAKPEPSDELMMQSKIMKYMALYGMSPSTIKNLIEGGKEELLKNHGKTMFTSAKLKPKALHVYDLGDGMLVPCEMMHELAHMFTGQHKKYGIGITQEMIEDDLYASHGFLKGLYKSQYLNEPAPAKPEPFIVHKAAKLEEPLFPGKVHLIASEYLTSPDSWFILDDIQVPNTLSPSEEALKIINEIQKQNAGKFGSVPQEQTPSAKEVTIPKKPSKVTKESLAHFHKLLGGKKNPYLP